MHLRFGFSFQKGGQFRECGIGLHCHLLFEQGEQLLVQGRRITTRMWQRRKALACTPQFHHSGDRAATDIKSVSNLVERAFASFISKYQFLS